MDDKTLKNARPRASTAGSASETKTYVGTVTPPVLLPDGKVEVRSEVISGPDHRVREDFSLWIKMRASQSSSATEETMLSVTPNGQPPGPHPAAPARLPSAVEEKYEDRGEVGHGGMGTVHRVFDLHLRRESALKLLKPEVGFKHREIQRFVDEAQITGQLDHPNIVPIHELGQDVSGAHYFTMKLVQGENLERAIAIAGEERLEPETLAELLKIFVKVCEAVAFAHSRGVIHRDLKPANIMVGEFGQVYVMDWGIARILAKSLEQPKRVQLGRTEGAGDLDTPGTIVGTPRYMAPEQVQGLHDVTDERADIFALGGTLYHILTGHAPYIEQNYFSLLVQVQTCEIQPPQEIPGCEKVPPELVRITLKAMSRKPEDRYSTVGELQRDVERFMRGVWYLPTVAFPAGAKIITEGDEGDAAYIITEGRCRVYKQGPGQAIELRSLGPGEVFGEAAIFSPGRRSATVEAIDDVKVTMVTSEVLTQGLGLNSWMGAFVRALADRFREVDQRLHQKDG
jgi:hypothetical protein